MNTVRVCILSLMLTENQNQKAEFCPGLLE